MTNSFNVLGVDWSPDYIKWYLNGQLIAEAPLSIDNPMSLSIGIGVAKDNGPFKPGPNDKTPFPNNFTVDYVRVYKTNPPPLNTREKLVLPIIQESYTPVTPDFRTTKLKAKLKNNRAKRKTEDILTISAIPFSKDQIELRVLGIHVTDTVQVDIHTTDKKLLNSVFIIGNNEIIVGTENNREIILTFKTKTIEFSENIKF